MLILSVIVVQALVNNVDDDGGYVAIGASLMLGAEVLVDWIKHAFITKFNRIDASVYDKYVSILCRDIAGCRKDDNIHLDHTHHVSRRLGLVSLPLAAVIIRMLWRLFRNSSIRFVDPIGWLLLTVVFLCLLATKILTSMLLMAHACRSGRVGTTEKNASPIKQGKNLDDLANIERYDLVRGRIV